MAKLSDFKINSQAVEDGEWISPGEEYDDLMIKTRGFTDQYADARAAKMRRAAQPFNGDVAKVPTAISRAITVDCLVAYALQDVKNIVDDAGQVITFAQFCQMLHDKDYFDLVLACIRAVSVVGSKKLSDLEDAEKN